MQIYLRTNSHYWLAFSLISTLPFAHTHSPIIVRVQVYMPPKKKATSKVNAEPSKSTVTCCVCCQGLNTSKDGALFCAGSCQQWMHRYCAEVSAMAYKIIKEKACQIRCFVCHQISQQEVERLRSEVARLLTLIDTFRSRPDHEATAVRRYASAVNSESNNSMPVSAKPSQL